MDIITMAPLPTGPVWLPRYLLICIASSILLYLLIKLGLFILRGYVLRLGFFSLHFQAPPGSRRYPRGVNVTVSTRFLAFIRSGFRGPFISLYSTALCMRLYGSVRKARRPYLAQRRRYYPVGCVRNLLYRIAAFWIRGLEVTVNDLYIYRSDGTWQLKATKFKFSGHTAGVLGYRYKLRTSSLVAKVVRYPLADSPVGTNALEVILKMQSQTEIDLIYLPRLITLFRPRHLAFMDDLKLKAELSNILLSSPNILHATINAFNMVLYPGYSRSLKRKLPPSAPNARRTRIPGIIRYWDSFGSLSGLSLKLTVPVVQRAVKEYGLFTWAKHATWRGCGAVGDHHQEPITNISLSFKEVFAGGLAVCPFTRDDYENLAHADVVNDTDIRGIVRKLIAARPEFIFYVSHANATYNSNFRKRDVALVDVTSSKCLASIEPYGLSLMLVRIQEVASRYFIMERKSRPSSPVRPLHSSASLTSCPIINDLQPPGVEGSVLLDQVKLIFLCENSADDANTQAVTFSAKRYCISKFVQRGVLSKFQSEYTDVQVVHVTESEQSENLTCGLFTLGVESSGVTRSHISLKNAAITWDADIHSGLCKMISSLRRLQNVLKLSIEGKPLTTNSGEEKSAAATLDTVITGNNFKFSVRFPDGPCSSVSFGHLPPFSPSDDIYKFHDAVWSLQNVPFMYVADLRLENPMKSLTANRRALKVTAAGVRGILKDQFWFGTLLQDWLVRVKACVKLLFQNDGSVRAAERSKDVEVARGTDETEKRAFPDIHVDLTDIEFSLEDSHLCGWMTQVLPLMLDENRERLLRERLFEDKLMYASSKQGPDHTDRLLYRFQEMHSKIYIQRIKNMKKKGKIYEVAEGHIEGLRSTPLATFSAAQISYHMVRNNGMLVNSTQESLRTLEKLDEFRGSGRMRHPNSWAQLGFREVSVDARGLRLRFRDYPTAFISVDSMKMGKGTFGLATQFTVAPYVTKAKVAIGRRRLVEVQKGIASTKLFVDAKLEVKTLQSYYNTAFVPVLTDFGRACARFAAESKNPSPKMSWFDNLRHNTHGRVVIVAGEVSGRLCGSTSPYTSTKHFVDVHAENVRFLASRLPSTADDPCPLSWELKNWYIWPNVLKERLQSEVFFEDVKVRLNPMPRTRGGDPLNHYTLPFPGESQLLAAERGVNNAQYRLIRAAKDVGSSRSQSGSFTKWTTPYITESNFDAYQMFRTYSMVLQVNVAVRHTKVSNPGKKSDSDATPLGSQFGRSRTVGTLNPNSLERWAPPGSSLCYSDGVTTLIKVIKMLAKKTVFCRPVPRLRDRRRKAPPTYGLGMVVNKSTINVNVQDLAVMIYNNLEPGCGIFTSLEQGKLKLVKERPFQPQDLHDIPRAKLVERKAEFSNLHSSIRVPGLDLGADSANMGFLCSVKQLILFDGKDIPGADGDFSCGGALVPGVSNRINIRGPGVTSSGFGAFMDSDVSPFYTFSPSNKLQRGKKLDKFKYKLRLIVFDLKMVWSPIRRNTLWTFVDVFKEKKFTMKAPPSQEVSMNSTGSSFMKSSETDHEFAVREELQLQNKKEDIVIKLARDAEEKLRQAERCLQSKASSARQGSSEFSPSVTYAVEEVLKSIPQFEVRIYRPQVIFGSPETDGWVFLTSEWANLGFVEKYVQKKMQTAGLQKWLEAERRVHLENSQLYTQWDDLSSFDFLGVWVPEGASRMKEESLLPLALVTTRPIALDLMYIKSRGIKTDNVDFDPDDDDQTRPSMLYINIKDIKMLSTSPQLYTVMNVIRKVLMQRAPISMKINEELTRLRYNLQLRGGKIPTFELKERLRRLRNITKQLKYCEETGQEELVTPFLSIEKSGFREARLRYQAKATATMTYLRTEHHEIDDNLYPTMYLSYSFDESSWILRDTSESKNPLVKLTLKDLVCRHVFYFGKGSSQEFTFRNISVRNMMRDGYFPAILHPNTDICSTSSTRPSSSTKPFHGNQSDIKASDGSSVAFRWYATQIERVGGIPVYDLLTINIAPLNAAMTKRLFDAIREFLFPKSHEEARQMKFPKPNRIIRADKAVRNRSGFNDIIPLHMRSKRDDLGEMEARGRETMHFKYIYIGECQLTASYKMKDNDEKGFLDFFDLAVESPSYMYSSKTWNWKGFFNEVKSDLLLTIAKRAAGKFAMLKLIPGYKGTRKTIKHTADKVGGMFEKRESSGQDIDFKDEQQGYMGDDEDGAKVQLISYFTPKDEKEKDKWCGLLFGEKPGARLPPLVPGNEASRKRKDRTRWKLGLRAHDDSVIAEPHLTDEKEVFGQTSQNTDGHKLRTSRTETDLQSPGSLEAVDGFSALDDQSSDMSC